MIKYLEINSQKLLSSSRKVDFTTVAKHIYSTYIFIYSIWYIIATTYKYFETDSQNILVMALRFM